MKYFYRTRFVNDYDHCSKTETVLSICFISKLQPNEFKKMFLEYFNIHFTRFGYNESISEYVQNFVKEYIQENNVLYFESSSLIDISNIPKNHKIISLFEEYTHWNNEGIFTIDSLFSKQELTKLKKKEEKFISKQIKNKMKQELKEQEKSERALLKKLQKKYNKK